MRILKKLVGVVKENDAHETDNEVLIGSILTEDEKEDANDCGEDVDISKKIQGLEYANILYLTHLEEVEISADHLNKEVRCLGDKLQQCHIEAEVQRCKFEVLQDEILYCKHEYDLIEGSLALKEKEIENLCDKCMVNEVEAKRKKQSLEEALRAKNKQLIDHINRDRGE